MSEGEWQRLSERVSDGGVSAAGRGAEGLGAVLHAAQDHGGLLDMYVHTGNEQALAVCESMANWVQAYFEGISDEQRQRMLRTEYGGMNEVLANLYGVTHKERYLWTARLFEQPMFLDPLAGRRDELKGLHVNTHVPKVIGAARMYELDGRPALSRDRRILSGRGADGALLRDRQHERR